MSIRRRKVEIAITIVITALTGLLVLAIHEMQGWKKLARKYKAFIDNPNVKVRDKEAEYKDSYEAKVNALEDERREQHEAIMQTFEVLNSLPSNPTSWPVEQLRQCRNVLLTAIQHSTYGRG
jgi:hypothetical protein